MQISTLNNAIKVLFLFFLIFAGLHFSKPFLVPFAIAGILSMLLMPLTQKMEKKGVARGLSIVICILLLIAAIAGIVILLSTQVAGISEDMPKIKQNIAQSIDKLKEGISKTVGVSHQQQQQMFEQQKTSGSGMKGSIITTIMSSLSSILVDTILVFVYIFLLMYFRTHLKKFILKLVPQEGKANAVKIITKSSEVASKYLSGLGMMIVMLWVMYGIGFSIIGVKNALFFAILCGLLEVIPFVGNVAGTSLTLVSVLSQGGSSNMIIGILITYGLVQFIQTYLLEPLVVGAEVNINPLFTIIIIVVAELVWGVPGMVLAIPTLGIIKVICDNIDPLKPYGFLIGEEKKKDDNNIINKVKGWFK
jgi:predicted PurR-regulated permease PerM